MMATAKSQGLPPSSMPSRSYDSPVNVPKPSPRSMAAADQRAMVLVEQSKAPALPQSRSRDMLRAQVAALTGRERPTKSYMSEAHESSSYGTSTALCDDDILLRARRAMGSASPPHDGSPRQPEEPSSLAQEIEMARRDKEAANLHQE